MKKLLQIKKMKSKFTLLMGILLFFSLKASAYDFEVNGIFYNIIDTDKVEVTYDTPYEMTPTYKGDLKIPEKVIYNETEYTVTSIGEMAFYNCNSLVSIDLPDSVTSIEKEVFMYCESLVSINLPDSLTYIGNRTFYNCSSLENIDIPNLVTYIGSGAFQDCSSLENINIPNSVTSIKNGVFKNCRSLISINLPESLISIGDSAFYGCISLASINLPDSLISIGMYAFYDCYSLENLDIPDSVTSIGKGVFMYCESLVSINLPNSVTYIEESTFSNCSSLENIDIPNSVTYIGRDAFYYCSSLESIDLPDKLSHIGNYAFRFCFSLKEVICRSLVIPELGDPVLGGEEPVFYGLPEDAVLYVYESVLENYENSDWAQYFSEILPISDVVEVSSIKISPEGNQEMTEGDTLEFTATVFPVNATDATVVWTTNDEDVISIEVSDENPNVVVVTALKAGEAVLTATAADESGVSARVEITVTEAPVIYVTSIEISPKGEQELLEGATKVFTATVLPENATDATVIWTTDDEDVITIKVSNENPNAVTITALETGETTLTATAADGSGVSTAVTITVVELVPEPEPEPEPTPEPVTSIQISPAGAQEMIEGTYFVFTANVLPDDATDSTVVWSTDNENIIALEVSKSKPNQVTVTALKAGKAVLTATAADGSGVSTSVGITVVEPVQEPEPEPNYEVINKYDISYSYAENGVVLEEASIKWKSDGELYFNLENSIAIAAVNSNVTYYIETIIENNTLILDFSYLPVGIYQVTIPEAYVLIGENGINGEIEFSITIEEASGIAGIYADADGYYNVYKVSGEKVLSTKDASKLKNLENGIYIINGKKVMLRK